MDAYKRLSGHQARRVPGWLTEWSTRFRTTTLSGCSVWIPVIMRMALHLSSKETLNRVLSYLVLYAKGGKRYPQVLKV